MATRALGTVVGVFKDRDQARQATKALKDAGFTEEQIGVAGSNRQSDVRHRVDDDDVDDDDESYAGEGAFAGAAGGAGVGALWGLGILAGVLPAIGPAIAGGTLAVLLSSAAAGAVAAGLAGALIGMGIPREEAEFYEGEMKAGRIVVTVNAGNRRDEALRILRQFGGYDMSNADQVRGTEHYAGAGQTVRAHEEQLQVHKKPVETGEARVRKEVQTEHKSIEVPVTREEVVIERRPASGHEVSASDLEAGQEIRIPVREEEVAVEKKTVATEDVSVGKRRVQETEHVDETLRKEKIDVDTKGDVKVRDRRS